MNQELKTVMVQIETTHVIVCPYCNYADISDDTQKYIHTTCDKCGKEFSLEYPKKGKLKK